MFDGIEHKDIKNIVGVAVSNPDFFGSHFRIVLEILALTDEQGFRDFMKILERKMPCDECHEHLLFKLSQIKERDDAFTFIISLHNMANIFKGKEEYTEIQRLEELYKSAIR